MKYLIIFILSIFVCLLVLLLERTLGIEWDYHIDVYTYITESEGLVSLGLDVVPNNFYYFVAYFLGNNVALMITVNVLAYSYTNILIAKIYYKFARTNITQTQFINLYLLLLLIAPYRVHLAVQGLKDTLIIMFLFMVVYNLNKKPAFYLSWIVLLLFRVYSLLYALLFIKGKNLLIVSFLSLLIVMNMNDAIVDFLSERSSAGMHSREYDAIPTFANFGWIGTLMRMAVWPCLLLSGVFVVISPTIWFVPIAFEIILSRIVNKKITGQWGLRLSLLIFLGLIAAVVDSYTAFIRYVYPAILAMPIIVMQTKNVRRNLNKSRVEND